MARHPRRPKEPELAVGMRLLERYSILARIGSGGMASIYRATDDRLDRIVCVKLLRRTFVEGSSGSRAVYQATYTHFLQEALALSKLQHPNTLRIYDFGYLENDSGEAGGAPFHVSEYLDGGTVETHVRRGGPLPPQEVLGILERISGAVAEAHEHGIIHRDIKPSNILFARVRGELVPKLADFGIASRDLKKNAPSRDGESESVSTVALFSPRWAAPEQLVSAAEGPRTDVYALGLLTIFMLTGTVLFGDQDVRHTFNDRVRSDALMNTRLSQLNLHPEVARTISRALLTQPAERIASAPEFAQLLRESLKIRVSTSVAPVRAAAPQPAAGSETATAPTDTVSPSLASAPITEKVPQERVVSFGERRLRYVPVHEALNLSFVAPTGEDVRFRVTMLPGHDVSLNVKGLTCFVAKRGGRPTPGITANHDGAIDLVSTARQVLGTVTVGFGEPVAQGRLFVVGGMQLLVTFEEAQQAVVLVLGEDNDIVVMCRS
ncbi:MAG TPA: serine/threonine-protein kinase [Labilithrix sp.]|nr:serine/threonine-protein kinase [Labilithrix sp.]